MAGGGWRLAGFVLLLGRVPEGPGRAIRGRSFGWCTYHAGERVRRMYISWLNEDQKMRAQSLQKRHRTCWARYA